eukprot:3089281-Alexandrium_andersonii.AAC.1
MFCLSWVGAPTGSPNPPVKVRYVALSPPWEVAVPARPTGPKRASPRLGLRQKSGAPMFRGGRLR